MISLGFDGHRTICRLFSTVVARICASPECLKPPALGKRLVAWSWAKSGGHGRFPAPAITSAVRRGKFLWLPLEPDAGRDATGPRALVTHLGMSGQVLLRAPGSDPDGLLRIRLGIEHPVHGELVVAFVDQRISGR